MDAHCGSTTGDVDGPVEEGRIVKAARPLDDFCLRIDDGGEPVETGALLEIIEIRPWGRRRWRRKRLRCTWSCGRRLTSWWPGGLWEWAS